MNFSKSKYCLFWQCPKMAWLAQFKPEERTVDASIDSRMESGIEAGELARNLFGAYTDVTTYADKELDIPSMLAKTEKELENHTPVICEAAFSYEGCYCAVDILKRKGDGWEIYEVKSSATGKNTEMIDPVYAADIAYQKYVLECCGIPVVGTYLVNINSEYVLHGELNIQELFCIRDASIQVGEELKNIKKNLSLIYTGFRLRKSWNIIIRD